MAKIHKFVEAQNLAQYQVWINDTSPTSTYFRLAQVPEVLTAGKNGFLIIGVPQLVTTTDVLVEIIDANGNTVFLQAITNYLEGLQARVISIEVYEDTPPGPATITILGHLATDINGNAPPSQFVNSYNVKWQKQVLIVPTNVNSTPVRLYTTPTLDVREVYSPFRSSSIGMPVVVSTGSFVISSQNTLPGSDQFRITTISSITPALTFNRLMVSGTLMATINGLPYTASIVNIVNSSIAEVDTPYVGYTSDNGPSTVSNYSISYQPSASFGVTIEYRSYVDLTLNQLTTFTGQIGRARVYAKSIDQGGDYQLMGDLQLTPANLLVTESLSIGEEVINMGDFDSQETVNAYWNAGYITSNSQYVVTSSVQPMYNSAVLLDSVHLNTGSLAQPAFFFGTKTPIQFSQNSEYIVSASIVGQNPDPNNAALMDVYLVGSSFSSSIFDPLGVQVASFTIPPNTPLFTLGELSSNVIASMSGSAYLRFIVYSGLWYVSDVQMISAIERGFNPDTAQSLIPVINRRLETLQFEVQLFDPNSNLLPITLFSAPTFFTGSTLTARGDGNSLIGTMQIGSIGQGIVLTANGYTASNGSLVTGSPAMYIGQGQYANANTPFFVASSSNGTLFSLGNNLTWDGNFLFLGVALDTGSISNLVLSASISASQALQTSSIALTSASNAYALAAAYSASIVQAENSASAAFFSSSLAATNVFTDSTGRIVKTPSTGSAGLYLGSTYLGYYNGSNWATFMSNTGNFFLTGSSNNYLVWNGSELTIAGNINLLSGPSYDVLQSASLSASAAFIASNQAALTASNLSSSLSGIYSTASVAQYTASAAFASSAIAALNIFTDSTGKIIKTPIPGGAGLYIGSTAMGYYDGTHFTTYMANNGNFFLTGSAASFLAWTGTTLTIAGNINLLSGPTYTIINNTTASVALASATASLASSSAATANSLALNASASAALGQTSASAAQLAANQASASAALLSASLLQTQASASAAFFSSALANTNVFTDSTGKIVKTPSTSSAGLYLGSTFMGYYNGAQWATFMSNTGNFYLTGSTNNFLVWDGSTLTIAGNINLLSGPSYATLTSASLSASLALASASLNQTLATAANFSASHALSSSSVAQTTANSALISASLAAAAASTALTSTSLAALDIFTDATGQIVRPPTLGGAGLYLGNNALGYYNGSSFVTYMANNGNFFLTGSSNSFLAWDGTSLTIAGNITLLDVTVPFGTFITPGQNLLTTSTEWIINGPPITASLVPGFDTIRGPIVSNSIALGMGPYSASVKLWTIRGTAQNSSDGGWVTDSITIDPTKTYRYTCWAMRSGSTGNPIHGIADANSVVNIDGTINASPVFYSSALPDTTGTQWYLLVGFVYPYNFGTTQLNNGGLYSKTTGAKLTALPDFKWKNIAVSSSKWRTDSWFSLNQNVFQYFYNPMVYVVDGTEPSIDSILSVGGSAVSSSTAAQNTATNASASAATANTIGNSTSASLSLVSSSFVQTRASASAAFVSSTLSALNIFTDSTGKIVKTPSTSSAGLYLGSTFMGYYNGANWATFMSNTGNFYLTGSSDHFLAWDGINLTIAGAITLLDLNIPFGTSITAGQNLLTSAQDWVVNGPPLTASLVANFNSVTAPASNSIQINPGPYGTNVPMWKVVGGTVGEGGWNTDNMSIDNTKAYRYAVWFYRAAGGLSGLIYHGCGANTVDNIAAGTPNSNPYFWFDAVSNYAIGNWYLVVGYVYPSNFGTIPETPAQSGVYRKTDGVKVSNGQADFKWDPNKTQTLWRTFLDSSTDTSTVVYFCSPMVHIVDGTEPSIDTLISNGTTAFANASIASGSAAGANITANIGLTSASLAQTAANNASASAATGINSANAANSAATNASSSAAVARTSASLVDQKVFTDSTGKIIKPAGTAAAGLYLDSTHLGFWNGVAWATFMSNTGNFYLTGSSNNFLSWDGANLTIAGNITLLDTIIPFGTSITPGQNLLNTTQQWVLNGPPIVNADVPSFEPIATIGNSITIASGPFGSDVMLWRVVSDGTNGPNGGWNTDAMDIDPTKTYRYTCWIRRSGSVGGTYHGVGLSTVADVATGTVQTNPYFLGGGTFPGDVSGSQWYLMVGFVYPYNYGTTQRANGGLYSKSTGVRISALIDFKWAKSTVNSSNWRSYLYYSTTAGTTQDFYNPMVHIVDGTEPTIDSLLSVGALSYASQSAASASLASTINSTSSSIGTTIGTVSSSLVGSIGNNSQSLAATIFTNASGQINKTPSPTTAGLYLGNAFLGYYNGSAWKTYMDNAGHFFLTGSSNNYLAWDGANLTIAGAINIVAGGNVATTASLNAATASLALSSSNASSSLASGLTTTNTTVSSNSQSLAGAIVSTSSSLSSSIGHTSSSLASGLTTTNTTVSSNSQSLAGAITTTSSSLSSSIGSTSSSLASKITSTSSSLSSSIGNTSASLASNIFTDSNGKLNRPPTTTGAGLYLGGTFLGYYNGTAWVTYMDNAGHFFLTGASNNFLSWDGANLTIAGAINIVAGGNAATTASLNSATSSLLLSSSNASSSLASGLTTTNTTVANHSQSFAATITDTSSSLETKIIITSSSLSSSIGSTSSSLASGLTTTNTTASLNSQSLAGAITTTSSSLSSSIGATSSSLAGGITNVSSSLSSSISSTSASLAINIFTSTTGLITKTPTASQSGLYLGSMNLGFYSSGSWKTYMDNFGRFFLTGTGGNSLFWDGIGTLSITGSIAATSGKISGNLNIVNGGSLTVMTTGSSGGIVLNTGVPYGQTISSMYMGLLPPIAGVPGNYTGQYGLFSDSGSNTVLGNGHNSGHSRIYFNGPNHIFLLAPDYVFIGNDPGDEYSTSTYIQVGLDGGTELSTITYSAVSHSFFGNLNTVAFNGTNGNLTVAGNAQFNNNVHIDGNFQLDGGNNYYSGSSFTTPNAPSAADKTSGVYAHKFSGAVLMYKEAGSFTGPVLGILGNGTATGVFTSLSDGRLKDDVTIIQSPLDIIEQIDGVRFVWNDKADFTDAGKKDIGFIAQDLQKVVPELVIEGHAGYLAVNYSGMVPILLEAIKELRREIELLKSGK